MTDTFEQKKIKELEQEWLRSDFGIEEHKTFLLETIRQARIEERSSTITEVERKVKNEQKKNLAILSDGDNYLDDADSAFEVVLTHIKQMKDGK